jgi:hypothetical protein
LRSARVGSVPARSARRSAQRTLGLLWFIFVVCAQGCSTLPKGHWGVNDLKLHGVRQLDPYALRACLSTKQRPKATLGLGTRDRTCGEPPFDHRAHAVRLFAWPWSDYPPFDEGVLKLDLKRIERWYEARGYYDASVKGHRLVPPGPLRHPDESCGRACTLDVHIDIEEGAPTRIRSLRMLGTNALPDDLVQELWSGLTIAPDDIFDEANYDAARRQLESILREPPPGA